VIRVLIAGFVACTVTGCAARHPLTVPATPTCFRMKVAVTADDGSNRLVAPGTPIDIVVRSQQGRVLHAVATDTSGNASFAVCWQADDPPSQVEAQLHFGQQFVGTLASFVNNSDTYCLTLPSRVGGHCGEWGTGPNSLLHEPK
jgi:type IV pilus biogenesis protein CpaD/CtpE